MSFIRWMVLRLRAMFLFGRVQREMDQEMRAHLDLAAERYMARGLSAHDARIAARREFGNVTALAADAREARGARWAESLATDVRLALRGLRRTPLFAAVAVVSISIGIGAATGIVTLAEALLGRAPAGVGHPERVVSVGGTRHGHGFDTFSYVTYTDYARATSLSSLAAIDLEPKALSLRTRQGGEAVRGGSVSGNFFSVLQARPALGRFFGPSEDSEAGEEAVVVLSDRYWHSRFNGDSSVVGRAIILNGTPFTVLGVAAPGFQGPFVFAPDLWMPLRAAVRLDKREQMLTERHNVWLIAIGRLAPGRTIAQAQGELTAIAARLRQSFPDESDLDGVRVNPLSLVPGDGHDVIAGFMAVLLVVAGLVLLVASTNVAGMLLARAARRRREIAMRIALGASRSRLVRQLVTESLVIGVAAGLIGLVLSTWLVRLVMALTPRLPVPMLVHPTLDARVLLFSLGITLLTAVAVGVLPAVESTAPDLVPALKIDAGATGRRHRLRGALLVSQIAVSMLLLIVAALFARSLVRARSIDPGFASHDIDVVSLDLGLAGYDDQRGVVQADALVEGARRLPGARAAALSAVLPLSGTFIGFGEIVVDGRPAPNGQEGWDAGWDVVTPAYFDVMRIPIVRGRAFTAADRAGTGDVAIVNEHFAMHIFGVADPVGRTFQNNKRTVTVIGVARDAKYGSLDEAPLDFLYVPMAQRYRASTNLVVRTVPGVRLAGALKHMVADLDPQLPVLDQSTMDDEVALSLFPQHLALWISGSLGVVALLLAVLGIYGVIAYSVAQRTREIGVRVALGAARGTILRMVLRQGIVLAAMGVAAGALLALGATRLLSTYLFGVAPTDVVAFGGAAALLAAATVAASWIPARQATRVDPMIALRAD
ncbi:MAG TPA: ABC transporter permease [Gemmatimonadaceae bacterium]|nr:ABC transporter permease [Gemmatimonadaceae bacterium]